MVKWTFLDFPSLICQMWRNLKICKYYIEIVHSYRKYLVHYPHRKDWKCIELKVTVQLPSEGDLCRNKRSPKNLSFPPKWKQNLATCELFYKKRFFLILGVIILTGHWLPSDLFLQNGHISIFCFHVMSHLPLTCCLSCVTRHVEIVKRVQGPKKKSKADFCDDFKICLAESDKGPWHDQPKEETKDTQVGSSRVKIAD